jgi:hypothetical protein
LERNTPDSLRYLVNDLFRKITLFDNRAISASSVKFNGGYETTITVQASKMYADSMGRETPAALNDWVDIAVLSSPDHGDKRGAVLSSQRVKMTEKSKTIKLFSKEKPTYAGIDPYYYLVDRIPDDNLKKVE